MIKKMLGIHKLERNIRNIHKMMGQHWGHTNNLYDHHQNLNNRIEELETRFDQKTQKILSVLNEVLRQLETSEESHKSATYVREPEASTTVIYNLSKNDDILLRILHERAAFSYDAAMPTKDLYNNLPFSITMRGLRKKLQNLYKEGFVATKKIGNERRWFIKTGSLSKVKALLRQRNEE